MNQQPKFLIGASIPRSGHNFLAMLLTNLFGSRMHYCDFYIAKDCCRQIPCVRRGDFSYIFQKSHEHNWEVPKGIAEAVYIIQYRHPVPEALSHLELDLTLDANSENFKYARTREYHALRLAKKAIYYRRFHDKWLVDPLPNGIYLDYDRLAAAPGDAVAEVVRAVGATIKPGRIEKIVGARESVRMASGKQGRTSFRPRVIEESPYFDADLLGAFEDYVITMTPRFGYRRMLSGKYEGHLIQGLILALDETRAPPDGQDPLLAAMALTGEHPEVMVRLAERDLRAGKSRAAIDRLERVVAQHPTCPRPYMPLLLAYHQQRRLPPASFFGSDSLFALAREPAVLVQAAKLFLEQGRTAHGIAALSIALTFDPKNAEAHKIAAGLLDTGNVTRALADAEEALRQHSEDETAAALLTTIRIRLMSMQ